MRLAALICRLVGVLIVAAAVTAPPPALAEAPRTRLLYVARDVDMLAAPPDALIAFDRLPAEGRVAEALFGARLRASPVSRFPETRPAPAAAFEELFVVIRAELGEGDTGARLSLGGEALTIPGLGTRLAATLDAFDVRDRRALFLEIVDPGHVFPAAMPAFRAALDPLDFDLQVVTVLDATGADAVESCTGDQPLALSLATGLADRAPFGDNNGTTTLAEAETYLGDALTRAVARGCGPSYNLIFKPEGAARDAAVVSHPLQPAAAVEDRLERETFEAMFLDGTENVPALTDYLAACTYCPGEARLTARRDDMAVRARIAELEDAMWDEIAQDTQRDRLAIYVDHCRLCLHSDEALTRIERLDAEAAAAESERRAFVAAQVARDLAGLRAYAETCVACTHRDEAQALIAEMESDADYQAERAQLTAALADQDQAGLDAYLAACTICDGAGEARALLDRLAAREALRAPCLAVAGLPQMGGPRKLEDIDQASATAACGTAAEAFPGDGLVRVILGRIAQAAGDDAAAAGAYAAGMDQDVPAAFGLAAYAAYAPADGAPIDPLEVEALALAGADKGDWLSHEVLSVLYSKDLVPGKTGRDAFGAALKIAGEGDPVAQYLVGHYYVYGIGTEPDPVQAVDWLGKAVAAGYTSAKAQLAEVYERGTGVAARPDQAAELLWTALGQGDAAATALLTTDLAERSAEVVRIIQGKLREQGLYRGAVDGVPGPGTEAAIRAYANSLGGQG
ncbi:MAG: SEL1-like repeat protein [Maritimibacter sp.]|nr:SEL1-like repeat protein [Maritimibacter sp.]